MSRKKVSRVELELPSGASCTVQGVITLNKSKVFELRYDRLTGFVRKRLFVSRKTEARESLADQGIEITSNADWKEILEAVDSIARFDKVALLEGPGWTGRYYAQQNGSVFAPAGKANPRVMFEPNREVAATKGTHEAWCNEIAEPLAGQVIPMVAVLAALAAPMLRFTGEKLNFGFEFSGAPETGKSTTLALMAATTGRPSSLADFNATMAGLEDMFAARSDSPFPVDEANLADGDAAFMKAFAFRMANGTVKVTRHQRDRAKYPFVYATTANQPFYTLLRGFHVDTAGAAYQRLIPLRVGDAQEGGVFNHLPEGFASFGAFATYLSGAMDRQYGTPMKRFLACLVQDRAKDQDRLEAQIQDKVEAFARAVGVAATNQGKTRASTYFGILYAAGCFAKHHAVLPVSWDCLSACIRAYRNYQAQLPTHTPLAARLLTIAKRPATVDLRIGELPKLSTDQVEEHGAFLHLGKGKRLELLFTESVKEQFFPDWTMISVKPEFKEWNRRSRDHARKQRTVRRGGKKEWLFCFVLPPALASSL